MTRIAICPGTKNERRCRNALAFSVDDRWEVRHRGRSLMLRPGVELAQVFDTVECENCGTLILVVDLDVHPYLPAPAAVA